MNDMGTFLGLKIYINESLYREESVRVYPRKKLRRGDESWQQRHIRRCERIQKKWDKRYGVKRTPYYVLMPDRVLMPTEFFMQLKLALEPREGGILGKKITGVIIDDPLY